MLISFLIFQISTNVAIVPVFATTVNATISRAHSNASAAAATLWHPAVTLVLILTSVNAITTFATTELVSTLSVLTNAIVIPVSNSVPTTIAPVSLKVIFKNYATLHHLKLNSRFFPLLKDVDECRLLLGICRNGRCRNTVGSFSCECADGYTLTGDGQNCRDINECTEVNCFILKILRISYEFTLFLAPWNMSSSGQMSEFDGIICVLLSSRIRIDAARWQYLRRWRKTTISIF